MFLICFYLRQEKSTSTVLVTSLQVTVTIIPKPFNFTFGYVSFEFIVFTLNLVNRIILRLFTKSFVALVKPGLGYF